MPTTNLADIIKKMKWTFLGGGTYNATYKSKEAVTIEGVTTVWILKIPKYTEDSFYKTVTDKARAVRKWRQLNPDLPAWEGNSGWISPYLGNTPATDEQIAEKLLDIYRRDQIILVDACTENNFLRYEDKTVCIDVDLALRSDSPVSDRFWGADPYKTVEIYWDNCTPRFPKSASLLRSLFYFNFFLIEDRERRSLKEKYLPDLTPNMMVYLRCLRNKKHVLTIRTMDILQDIIRRGLELPEELVFSLCDVVARSTGPAARSPDASPVRLVSSLSLFAPIVAWGGPSRQSSELADFERCTAPST